MYSLPQEIEVWYVIPALRKELAKGLVGSGLSMEKAGNILGISKAAVSQYLSNKRANKMKFNIGFKKEIGKSSKLIVTDNGCSVSEMQRLLKEFKKTKQYCEICRKFNSDISKHCKCKCNCCE